MRREKNKLQEMFKFPLELWAGSLERKVWSRVSLAPQVPTWQSLCTHVRSARKGRLRDSFINSDALSRTKIDFLRIVVSLCNSWYIPFWISRSTSALDLKITRRIYLQSNFCGGPACRDLSLFCSLMVVWPVSCWRVWPSRQHVEVFATEGNQLEKCRKGGEA